MRNSFTTAAACSATVFGADGTAAAAGAAASGAVGVVLHKKLGDRVEEGESLATVHANDPERAAEAITLMQECFEFTSGSVVRPPFIHQILGAEI